jgi:hypothetical protein
MTAADSFLLKNGENMNIDIKPEDIQRVCQENPLFAAKLEAAALRRALEEALKNPKQIKKEGKK